MGEADYRAVPDGGILQRLDSGLMVIRRRKHEWNPLADQLRGEKLARFTGKVSGSKFAREWTLERQVQWMREQVQALGWTDETPSQDQTFDLAAVVGYSKGRPVTRIRVELSSRSLHAYPVED